MKYEGKRLEQISFPIGGIGTGSIGLAGNGHLVDWEIFNTPDKGSLNGATHIAVRAEYPDGRVVVKILQSAYTHSLMGKYSQTTYNGFGYGPNRNTMAGFPHFEKASFEGEYPFATITFSDADFPADVVLTAFNPLIPLDAENSSLPAAFFAVRFLNGDERIRYTVAFALANPFASGESIVQHEDGFSILTHRHAGVSEDDVAYGELALLTEKTEDTCAQAYWYRGEWLDPITTYWNELLHGDFAPRTYDTPAKNDHGTLAKAITLQPHTEGTVRFILAWSIPKCINTWSPYKDEAGKDVAWKNYYATRFAHAADTAKYAIKNYDELSRRSRAFSDAVMGATLDESVKDAILGTVSVLKSPTVLRLEDGTFWGWEGVHEKAGSCEGSCTHVWNYAYALCFLFPDLERTLRETEVRYDIEENGKMHFRTFLPLGRGYENSSYRPCVDGQMGTVIKIYRDFKITGDDSFIRANWERIKACLAYAWSEENPDCWDRDRDGVLEGRQHHTLDMELYGPSSWLEGMYLAALRAASLMAEYLGDTAAKAEYEALFAKGYDFMKTELFNGKYFIQKLDLADHGYIEKYDVPNYWNEEAGEIKYQVGEGSVIDQMLAQWHAHLCGLGDIYDPHQRKIALASVYENNFKPRLADFANMWRLFALNDEAGAVICDYPEGAKRPSIPVPYEGECMTGFEYALAGLLISEGETEKGLSIVRAIRDRYDGEKRNPYNEMECGSNYARAMASFALLPIFSGFTFDLAHGYVGFSPVEGGDFRAPFFLGTGWGIYGQTDRAAGFTLTEGTLALSSYGAPKDKTVRTLTVDGKAVPFTQEDNRLSFEALTVKESLAITY
ncbi:MAG: hypothetical protein IJV96_03600 [Clostridia bacterium]|nr:hypothetical protein [Clostridia bacterium]